MRPSAAVFGCRSVGVDSRWPPALCPAGGVFSAYLTRYREDSNANHHAIRVALLLRANACANVASVLHTISTITLRAGLSKVPRAPNVR